MNTQPPSLFSSFAIQQEMLLKHVELLLSSLDPYLKADVSQVFQDPERLLGAVEQKGDDSAYVATYLLFPFLIAQCIEPEIDTTVAASVAIAITCFVYALDLLDDIEDEKQAAILADLGLARVLNVSTALLALAQRLILTLSSQAVAPEQIVALLTLMQEAILKRQADQGFSSLSKQKPRENMQYTDCLESVTLKARRLIRLICQSGAMCAGADKWLCEQFALLGQICGEILQLNNEYDTIQRYLQSEDMVLEQGIHNQSRAAQKTLMIILAAERSAWMGNTSPPESTVKELQTAINAINDSRKAAQNSAQEVLQRIQARLPLTRELQQILTIVI